MILQPQPVATSPVFEAFRPQPANELNEVKVYAFVGLKFSKWTDEKTGQLKTSYKVQILTNSDDESEYSEFIGRVSTTLPCTADFYAKVKRLHINPQEVTPYWFETKSVAGSKGSGMKHTVVDIHLSPYQKEQLQKGIQPLTINPPN